MSHQIDAEVVIVGGGPVGLGLAADLGRRRVETVVIERDHSLHTIPKGQNLTQRTMEHLRFWGVEEAVRSARVMPTGYPAAGVNAYGTLMGEYAHPWFRRSAVDPYYFTRNERLPQYLTEAILRDRIETLPAVTARYGVRAATVRQEGDSAVVETDRGPIQGQYVVGCDGSHSIVRDSAGIGEHRSDHDRRMVLIVFRSTQLHELLEQRFGKVAFFNVLHPDLDGYWRFLGRVDVGEGWFFHAPVPDESTSATVDPRAQLRAAVGEDIDLDVDYLGFWDLRVAVADSYRKGRVFLAGDSAHSHPPYGGYGINTGFEDARNLGWKIEATLRGWGGDGLLDSYSDERRPVFISTARDFIEAFIERDRAFIGKHDPSVDLVDFEMAWGKRGKGSNRGVSEFEPHYEGSRLVFGPDGGVSAATGDHTHHPRPGHHLPPPRSGDSNEVFEALGQGFSLISPSADSPAIPEFEAAAKRLGLALKILTSMTHPSVDGYAPAPVLVRPDHFVAWVDDGSLYEAGAVLARSVGRAYN